MTGGCLSLATGKRGGAKLCVRVCVFVYRWTLFTLLSTRTEACSPPLCVVVIVREHIFIFHFHFMCAVRKYQHAAIHTPVPSLNFCSLNYRFALAWPFLKISVLFLKTFWTNSQMDGACNYSLSLQACNVHTTELHKILTCSLTFLFRLQVEPQNSLHHHTHTLTDTQYAFRWYVWYVIRCWNNKQNNFGMHSAK